VDSELLQTTIDALAIKARHRAQDYLTEDRLSRRVRFGQHLFMAELRGYQDTYHPWVEIIGTTLSHGCDCSRPGYCSHTTALFMDLERLPIDYPEISWTLAQEYYGAVQKWVRREDFPWSQIPEMVPPWRYPAHDEKWAKIKETLQLTSSHHPLAHDRHAMVFAEAHPTWLSYAPFLDTFSSWIANRRVESVGDIPKWVSLQWFQPQLPLNSVWIQMANNKLATQEWLQQLFTPNNLIYATAQRERVSLTALTLIDSRIARPLWSFFNHVDPTRVAEADALYLSGHVLDAIHLLETNLPDAPRSRLAVRQRLIAWLSLEDSIPHRLALAWETGSEDVLEPVKDLLSSRQRSEIMQALSENRGSYAPLDRDLE